MQKATKSKGTRAIEPIFASLILIAIAVTGGIVVYMYTSGYLSGMTGGSGVGQEKLAIVAIVVNGNSTTLSCKALGGADIVITDAVLKNAAGQTLQVVTLGTAVTVPGSGALQPVAATFSSGLVAGSTYTVTLVSSAGNQFVSAAFTA